MLELHRNYRTQKYGSHWKKWIETKIFQTLLLLLRLSSSRAFGHIGQQLGAILNGQLQLQHIQPLPTWSRPSTNPAGKFCATSSWSTLFYACHLLESRILPLHDLVSAVYDNIKESAFCYNVWQFSGVGPEQDFIICNVVFVCDF